MTETKKHVGRPAKKRDPNSRDPVTFWISFDLRSRLIEAAEQNHRTLAQETEHRLELMSADA